MIDHTICNFRSGYIEQQCDPITLGTINKKLDALQAIILEIRDNHAKLQ